MITKFHELTDRACKNSKSRSKSKSKSKTKTNFNPIKFLHAQIDIPAPHKKKNITQSKRHNNTLQPLTPLPNIQPSVKSRSKTSYSQYRRRDTPLLKDLININLSNIVTEQDCVRYTETLSNENQKDHFTNKNKVIQKGMSLFRAAIIIQRAYRKYKTLSMIKKYYKHYGGVVMEELKGQQQTQLEKTLKIRSEVKGQNHCTFTRKNSSEIMMERIKDSMETPPPKCTKYKEKDQKGQRYQNDDIIAKMRKIQAKRLEQAMKIIPNQRRQSQSDGVLDQLLRKLQQNKQNLQKDIQSQQNSIFQTPILNKNQGNQHSSLNLKQSIIGYSRIQQQFLNHVDSQNQYNFGKNSESAECKLLNKRIYNIRQNYELEIVKLQALGHIGTLNQDQFKNRMLRLTNNTQNQIKYLQNLIKSYQSAVHAITNIAIDQYRQAIGSKSISKFRKSFSSQSIVLKCIFKEEKISQMEIIHSPFQQHEHIIEQNKWQSNRKSEQLQIVENDYQIIEHNFEVDKDDGVLSQSFMRQFSENYQKQIEQMIVRQVALQIFMSQVMYKLFRSQVEVLHQFHQISDNDIALFLNDIQAFYPEIQVLQRLFNQKINPTPSEILRIIRDQQCQLQQYEIILSESIFTNYRLLLDRHYQYKKEQLLGKVKEVQDWVKGQKIRNKIQQKISNKKNNLTKYIQFEKDLKVIYLKSVFNCLNQYLIQYKSSCTYMNTWSSIGPGQLKLSLKQYNKYTNSKQVLDAIQKCNKRIIQGLKYKCIIPNFYNANSLQLFYKFSHIQLENQLNESQYKWVNFMDESLEIWMDLTIAITNQLIHQAAFDIIKQIG